MVWFFLVLETYKIALANLGHIPVTLTIELQMEQALLTVESPVNIG